MLICPLTCNYDDMIDGALAVLFERVHLAEGAHIAGARIGAGVRCEAQAPVNPYRQAASQGLAP
jgi:hypothetical protein